MLCYVLGILLNLQYFVIIKRRWPSGRVFTYPAQGTGFNPWPSHTKELKKFSLPPC